MLFFFSVGRGTVALLIWNNFAHFYYTLYGALQVLSAISKPKVHHLVFLLTEQVIENHSKQQERQRQDDTTELEPREEDTQEEVAEDEEEDEEEEEYRVGEGDVTSPEVSFASQSSPYTDGRLVKSHSEAPIGSPKG